MKKKKLLLIIVLPAVILISTGVALGLNGWFGGGSSIPEDTLTRGLVGYWSFDEGSGTTAYDASGYANSGTLTNGPSWTSGKLGGALNFDGVDNYVDIGTDTSLDITDTITVEMWAKMNTLTTRIDALYHSTSGYYLNANNTGQLGKWRIWLSGISTMSLHTNKDDFNTTDWYHIVATYNKDAGSNNYKIYVDGVLDNQTTATGQISNAMTEIGIGGASVTTYDFDGLIDEVRIYNRALSAEEVRYHYNRGGPVAHWKFDEGSGSTAYDSTENNNDATLYGEMATSTSPDSGWTTGKYGSALAFDGVNDYINVLDDSTIDPSDAITMEAWVYPGVMSSWAEIFRKNAAYVLSRNHANGNTFYGNIHVDGAWRSSPDITYNINEWIYIVTTYSSQTREIKIYKNGIYSGKTTLSGLGTYNITDATGNNLLIGTFDTTQSFFKGRLDKLKIYNYARTPEEIRLDYNAGFGAKFGYSLGSCSRDPASCMNEGLVGYWNFEERSGTTAYDLTDNSNNGTLTSGPSWTKGVKPLSGGAEGGGALQFDGTDDYVSYSNPTIFDITKAVTLEGWVKFNSLPPLNTAAGIISKWHGTWDGTPYQLYIYNSAGTITVRMQAGSGTDRQNAVSTFTPELNTWYHFVGTYNKDDGYVKLYSNGTLNTSQQYSQTMSVTSNSLISGAFAGTSAFFDGLIDEVRMYNRALSAEEIRYHYNQRGPVAHWKFDEGSGTTVYDATNNSYDGTMYWMSTSTNGGWARGRNNSALYFDGVDDCISVDNSAGLDITEKITVSAWIKYESPSFARIVSRENPYMLGISSNGKISYFHFYNSVWYSLYSNSSVKYSVWSYITMTQEASGSNTLVKLYINGKLDNSATLTGRPTGASSSPTTIGCYGERIQYFKGYIDDVSIYDYIRTEDQIRLDYNAGLAAHFGPSGKDCSSDPASCINEGLVGYWNFEERSGTTAYDSSDYANNGTLASGPSWAKGIKPLSGGYEGGSALQFDGTDDYVDCGNDASLNYTSEITVEFWFLNRLTMGSGIYRTLIERGDWTQNWGVLLNNYKLQFMVRHSDDTTPSIYSNTATVKDTWYHVAIVWQDSTKQATFYLNGNVDGIGTFVQNMKTTSWQPLLIGKSGYGYHNGLIDEVRIYNRALSPEEVRYHYNQGDPVAHWKFNEGMGTTVYDATPNDVDGTISGADWVEGKHGSALSFDGVDDYVDLGSNLDIGTDVRTFEFWLKSSYNSVNQSIIGTRNFNTDGYIIQITPTFIELYNAVTATNIQHIGEYLDGNWHHFVIVRAGTSDNAIYVDGVKKTLSSNTENLSDTASTLSTKIGEQYGSGVYYRYLSGIIDDVRIYNYARTPEQILQDYNAGMSTYFK